MDYVRDRTEAEIHVLVTVAAPPDPFAPASLGPLQLRNRVVKAATFEGVMPAGAVSDELIEFVCGDAASSDGDAARRPAP